MGKARPTSRLTRKTRIEHTRAAGETDEGGDQEDDEDGQDDGVDDDAGDYDEEEDYDDQEAAPDVDDAEVEPSSLVVENRYRPVSRGDFDFDEDALYPTRWGAEHFRLAREQAPRESVLMAKESAVARAGEPAGSTTRAASVAPVVDRSQMIPDMPPEALVIKAGFNCVIVVRIGGVPFRVVLDTGAARSLIRTSFADQLRKNRKTRGATYGPRPLNRPVLLEGVIRGRPSATITSATQVGLDLLDTVSGRTCKLEACFWCGETVPHQCVPVHVAFFGQKQNRRHTHARHA